MKKFKITIREIIDIEGEKYPKEETIFEQVMEDIDVSDLVVYLNKKEVEEHKNSTTSKNEDSEWKPIKVDFQQLKNQIVEEERKRILSDLPLPRPQDLQDWGLGFNNCLSQVRNIISKPNI